MPIDPAAVQRVRSHVARIQPNFDRVVAAFFRRFTRQCPHAAKWTAPGSKTSRYIFAEAVCMVTKNLGSLDEASNVFAWMTKHMNAAGLTQHDMQALRSSLLGAIGECSGTDWSRQLDADFSQAIGAVFSRVKLTAADKAAVRKAA